MRVTRAIILPLSMLLLALSSAGQDRPFRISEIDFFGYSGIDLESIRKSLPIREGAEASQSELTSARGKIKKAITETNGIAPTDATIVCCDKQGGVMIYIGLPGKSFRRIPLNPAPHGRERLPREPVDLYQQVSDLLQEAVKVQPGEDRSQGYSISLYEPLRQKQLLMREWAMHNSALLIRVLKSSSDPNQRAVAAEILGYALQSRKQVAALAKASRDQDEGVRNNATRALGLLAESSPRVANWIPANGFIEMLNSGIWSDRNKAALLVEVLSRRRNPVLLNRLRAKAFESLIEMARWRSPSHASNARSILGRIAGIEEARLQQLVASGQVEVIVDSARR